LTRRLAAAEEPRVPADARPPAILALLARGEPLAVAMASVREAGMAVEVVHDAAAARGAFFRSGGHDCLVIGPTVARDLAAAVAATLQAVDPDVSIANFGPPLAAAPRPTRVVRLHGLHPASRAGVGALLRFLRTLRRT
jgi:hypothetical protein